MKKSTLVVLLLLAALLFSGCEALSLAENAQPLFAGPDYSGDEEYYKDYYYPKMDFDPATEALFRPFAYGKEYIDDPLYISGTVKETKLIEGIKYYILSTEYGEMYINNKLFTLEKVPDGSAVTMYFVYSGYNEDFECVTGAYVYCSVK